MEHLIFSIYFLFCMVFLFLPYLQGKLKYLFSLEKSIEEIQHLTQADLKDRIVLLKESLKYIELEKQVGKLSQNDFISIQKEILEEWESLEKELKYFNEFKK